MKDHQSALSVITMRFVGECLSRRSALAAALTLSACPPPLIGAAAKAAESVPLPSAALLSLLPEMPFGAPATNATLPAALVSKIEMLTAKLERDYSRTDSIRDQQLNGSWRLLYSDGREITSLARGFPGGFELGPTFQPLDLATGRFENQGSVVNRFGVAKLSTCVIGDVSPAPAGSRNAAGVVNDRGNRIDVNFKRITFSLDELLGRPVSVRKVLVPQQKAGVEQPANDVTYLDSKTRVTRGGDGALFIFRREETDRPMLTLAERETLYMDVGGIDVVTGTGQPEDSAPAELKRLLKDR